MALFEKQVLLLKKSITDLNILTQIRLISQISACIEQSTTHEKVIQDFLNFNLASAINDVICTQLTVLRPTMRLIRHLMEDYHFRTYQFLPIMKNILRALVFVVQSDEIEKYQLEFFDIIDIFDVLMKKYLSNDFSRKKEEGMQVTFVCVMKFIELVLSHDCVDLAVKNLMVEIYFHLLRINWIFKCISNNFELIMKVANMGDEFLDHFIVEYEKDRDELWLYKILQTLLKIFESFVLHADSSNILGIKVFEDMFMRYIKFVWEPLLSSESVACDPELFKLCIAVLNVIIWTPVFSQHFYSKILTKFIKLNGDSMVFCLSKSSTKIRKYTTYSMKIFLTALTTYSDKTPPDKHEILNMFLQCRLYSSIYDLRPHEVIKGQNALILLYGSSFLRQRLSNPLNAHKALENLLIILNHSNSQMDDEQIWGFLTIFAYCSNYATLSELEYAGVQKTSEILLSQASRTVIDIQKIRHPIDKYIIALAKEFCTNLSTFNSMTFLYLSQQPSLTSPKVSEIIPTHNVLPLLISSDYNQVENAVKILQRKQLSEEDLDFVIEQCFHKFKVEEVIIGAAMNIININLGMISDESTYKIYSATIAFIEAKQLKPHFSEECYLCIWKTCVNLFRSARTANTVGEM